MSISGWDGEGRGIPETFLIDIEEQFLTRGLFRSQYGVWGTTSRLCVFLVVKRCTCNVVGHVNCVRLCYNVCGTDRKSTFQFHIKKMIVGSPICMHTCSDIERPCLWTNASQGCRLAQSLIHTFSFSNLLLLLLFSFLEVYCNLNSMCAESCLEFYFKRRGFSFSSRGVGWLVQTSCPIQSTVTKSK